MKTTTNPRFRFFKKISWGAIIAGVIIAIVIQLLLSILGLGIGFGSINPTAESRPFEGLGTGTLIWWIISMVISLFIGGWVVGRESNLPRKTDRMINGVLMWCIFTLISFYTFTSLTGNVIGGAGTIVGKTLASAGNGIQASPGTVGFIKESTGMGDESLLSEAPELFMEADKEERQEIRGLINKLFKNDGNAVKDEDKQALINVIVRKSGKSRSQAETQVNGWIIRVQENKGQTVQQVRETGEKIVSAISRIAIFSFIGLLLGAIASSVGSLLAKPVYNAVELRDRESSRDRDRDRDQSTPL